MRHQYGENAFAQLLWMINQSPRSYAEQTIGTFQMVPTIFKNKQRTIVVGDRLDVREFISMLFTCRSLLKDSCPSLKTDRKEIQMKQKLERGDKNSSGCLIP